MIELDGDLFDQGTDAVAILVNAVVLGSGCSYLELSGVDASKRWPGIDHLIGQSVLVNGCVWQRLTDQNRYLNLPNGKRMHSNWDVYALPISTTWWGPIETGIMVPAMKKLATYPGSIAIPNPDGEGPRKDSWARVRPAVASILADDRFVVVRRPLTEPLRSIPLPLKAQRFLKTRE